ncbi:MAG TPA: IS200/IS605 family transposase [Chryseosolibacter sp.]|nr:IS200/IS605 family transposase [Chryseosolibacter sp.]
MSQSLVKNYLHIVFSTKYRQPIITSAIESDLHSYLAGICKEQECAPVKIGGYTDHIHVLCELSKKTTLATFMRQLKAYSSAWAKTRGEEFSQFRWQDGYGAFSVNPSQLHIVKRYIENQHAHHQEKTFQREYRTILEKYKVPYDERYVWD